MVKRIAHRAWAAGLVLAAGTVGAAEGPVMRSLQSASVAPLGATLEAQSAAAGAPFAGNDGGPGFSGKAAAGERAPRLSSPGLKDLATKGRIPPPITEKEEKNLKIIRGVGLGAAAVGLVLFAYSIATLAAGPIGWAAALVFFGGMAAYLSHRRLKGTDDFGPSNR